jgi:hypothetical protein
MMLEQAKPSFVLAKLNFLNKKGPRLFRGPGIISKL